MEAVASSFVYTTLFTLLLGLFFYFTFICSNRRTKVGNTFTDNTKKEIDIYIFEPYYLFLGMGDLIMQKDCDAQIYRGTKKECIDESKANY